VKCVREIGRNQITLFCFQVTLLCFLASPDAQEVIVVSHSVSHWVSPS